jgi:hypothetical protein
MCLEERIRPKGQGVTGRDKSGVAQHFHWRFDGLTQSGSTIVMTKFYGSLGHTMMDIIGLFQSAMEL